MSQKTQTQQNTNQNAQQNQQYANQSQTQFNPLALSTYQNLIGSGSNFLTNLMQNPMQSAFGTQLLGAAMKGANTQAQGLMSNVTNNIGALGGGVAPGAFHNLLLQAGAAGSNLKANAYQNMLLNLANLQRGAAGSMLAFSPLATGSTGAGTQAGTSASQGNSNSTQTVSGLGTWLPQLLGAGVSALTGGLFGGGGGGGSSFTPSYAGQPLLAGNYNNPLYSVAPSYPMPSTGSVVVGGMPSYGGFSNNPFLSSVPAYGS